MRTEDGYIISQCLNGNPDAFGMLVDKYKGGIYAFAYGKLHNFHDAQDIAQEVFIKAYEKLHTLRHWENFAAWLFRIASRQCRNWVRAQTRKPDHDYIEDDDTGMLDRRSLSAYRHESVLESVRDALDSLPDIHREVLMLHYLGGMTSYEIARATNAAPATVRRRIVKARALLKSEMLGAIKAACKEQKLQASFTLRVLETTRHIRVRPLLKEATIPWGVSIAAGLLCAVLSIGTSRSPLDSIYGRVDTAAYQTLAGVDEIPVVILDHIYDQGREDAGTLTRVESGVIYAPAKPGGSIYASEPSQVWTRYQGNPVMGAGKEGEWDEGGVSDPSVLFDGVIYRMWYHGNRTRIPHMKWDMYRIGYATSLDGVNWTKHPYPVLNLGESGEWDDYYVARPTVVFDGSEYKMWYAGRRDGQRSSIGLATSPDGVVWEKYPNNPVIRPGASGAWDDYHVNSPCVLFDGTTYKMWYAGYNSPGAYYRVGYATSTDGIVWEKHPANPVLETGSPEEEWDSGYAWSPAVVFDGVEYRMWYTGIPRSSKDQVHRIGHAASPDGINWQKSDGNPSFTPGISGKWDDGGVLSPAVMLINDTYKLWYTGSYSRGGASPYGICYATSPARRMLVNVGGELSPASRR